MRSRLRFALTSKRTLRRSKAGCSFGCASCGLFERTSAERRGRLAACSLPDGRRIGERGCWYDYGCGCGLSCRSLILLKIGSSLVASCVPKSFFGWTCPCTSGGCWQKLAEIGGFAYVRNFQNMSGIRSYTAGQNGLAAWSLFRSNRRRSSFVLHWFPVEHTASITAFSHVECAILPIARSLIIAGRPVDQHFNLMRFAKREGRRELL